MHGQYYFYFLFLMWNTTILYELEFSIIIKTEHLNSKY